MPAHLSRPYLLIVLLLGNCLQTAPATDKELLDILLGNGAITQKQYDALLEKEHLNKQDVQDIKIKLDGKGLRIETADKAFKMAFGGRVHFDVNWLKKNQFLQDGQPVQANDGTEIRRGRIYVKGLLWHDWKFISEFDFANNSTAVKDLSLTYLGIDWLELSVGHQKQAISMELQESSNDIMFTERSLVYSLTHPVFDRALGLLAKTKGSDWSMQLGFYGDSIKANDDSLVGNEGWGVTSRLTYAPINEKHYLVHLGTYGGYRVANSAGDVLGNSLHFRYETTNMSNIYLTDTDTLADSSGISLVGAEAAAMWHYLSLQFEYAHAWVDRDHLPTLNFDAWYVQAAWTITGESRTYKGSDGEFKRLLPAQALNFKTGGWGALELAARFDGNDLISQEIIGGSETAFTIALNWYVNRNIRFMANYRRSIHLKDSPLSKPDGSIPDDLHTFTIRSQWAF